MARDKKEPRMASQIFKKKADKAEPPIIELKNVKLTYKNAGAPVKALRNLNLKVERGEMMAIMGPSGSGKTTLLNVLGLLDSPDSGDVLFAGVDVGELKRRKIPMFRQKEIGMIFQNQNLVPTLTAYENVYLPLRYIRGKRSLKREQVQEALRLTGMSDRAKHLPSKLSGGEQQRIAIARALVLSPAVVLADEPTGELDSKTGKKIVQLMHHLNEQTGQTFIIVTHNEMVAETCDRTLQMQDGKLIETRRKPRKKGKK